MNPVITGWSHLPFGKFENFDIEEMIARVSVRALQHAAVDPRQIDSVHIGTFNAGFYLPGLPLCTDSQCYS